MLGYPKQSGISSPLSGQVHRLPIRLSIERPSGERHYVEVTIDRVPADDDGTVMAKACAEYRRLHGVQDRVVAIYVTTTR
jgi:hypothetical protein